MLHDGTITMDDVRKMKGLPPLPDGLGAEPMVWTGAGPVLLRDIVTGKHLQQPTAIPGNPFEISLDKPLPPLAHGGPVNAPEIALPGGDGEEEFVLPEISIKSELEAWEAFALKRLGKANSRPFACKAVPEAMANEIQNGLKSATDTKAVKAVFEVARRNIGRRRTPAVEGNLVDLMSDYEGLIKQAVEIAINATSPAVKAEFDESEHPRANDGKFTSGSGGGGGSSSGESAKPTKAPSGKPAAGSSGESKKPSNIPENITGSGTAQSSENSPNKPQNDIILKPGYRHRTASDTHTPDGQVIPPGWRNVQVAEDKNAKVQARGIDKKGRKTTIYSEEWQAQQSAKKFNRQSAFVGVVDPALDNIDQDLTENDEAVALAMMAEVGFRIGGTRNTGADVQAYGATTLLGKHVKIEGDTIHFDFIGKKGVRIQQSIKNAKLADVLRPRITDPDKPILNTSAEKVRKYLKRIAGPEFKPKDFRTWTANRIAKQTMESMPTPKTEKEFNKARLVVGAAASKVLGNSRTIALESYIDPRIFDPWREAVKGGSTDDGDV